ncbi:MAG: substrate-binding domain-containing protein, partial [Lachnospiraceae bacterium]|nr:substrate-binding domain-containing protein [Lachnospiraceae bacterium]
MHIVKDKRVRILIMTAAALIIELVLILVLSLFLKRNILISAAVIMQAPLITLIALHFHEKQRARLLKLAIMILVGGLIGLLACYGRNNYVKRISSSEKERISLIARYYPFDETSKAAGLSEEPEIALTEDLPVLDGTAGLFPMYSAIVHYLYPADVAGPDEEGSPYLYSEEVGAVTNLLRGRADLVFSEQLSEETQAMAAASGRKLMMEPLALDALVFIINSDNPVQSLTSEQLRLIYSGQVTNWKELGGKDEKIIAYQANRETPAYRAMDEFMDGTDLMDPDRLYTLNADHRIEETAADYINVSGAIGYTFYTYTDDSLHIEKGIKVLAVDGISPNYMTISHGFYPYLQYLYCCRLEDEEVGAAKPGGAAAAGAEPEAPGEAAAAGSEPEAP